VVELADETSKWICWTLAHFLLPFWWKLPRRSGMNRITSGPSSRRYVLMRQPTELLQMLQRMRSWIHLCHSHQYRNL
jgi:hypothetical protein